ncbi:MAG: polymorphic toxin-type HINT domain-containing protein, partial [Planctomycetota bacterium]
VDELRAKSMFDFVPKLLAAMSSPISYMTIPVIDPAGQFQGFRQAFAKEGMNENRVWRFDSSVSVVGGGSPTRQVFDPKESTSYGWKLLSRDESKPFGSRNTWEKTTTQSTSQFVDLAAEENARALSAARFAAFATGKMLEAKAKQENVEIAAQNARIADVISDLAGVQFETLPKDAWNWWDKYNETDYQRSKLKRYRYNSANQVAYMRRDYGEIRESLSDVEITYGSCFVAGTKVLTSRGPKAIETILPGDLVLSRSVASGELGFKPVVTGTNRAPTETVILHINDEKLHATRSHLLWVSGKGWIKAGEVKVGDLLHSAAEPAVVMGVQKSGVLPTFNLIVADNHTYFVGSSQVLSHDVLPRGSVQEQIPGQFALSKHSAKAK